MRKSKAERRFLKQVRKIVDHTSGLSLTDKKKCELTAFSILVLLDGENPNHPPCDVIPLSDKKKNIAGNLHNHFIDKYINDEIIHEALIRPVFANHFRREPLEECRRKIQILNANDMIVGSILLFDYVNAFITGCSAAEWWIYFPIEKLDYLNNAYSPEVITIPREYYTIDKKSLTKG